MAEPNQEEQAAQPAAETMEASDFESLLKKEFKPKGNQAKDP